MELVKKFIYPNVSETIVSKTINSKTIELKYKEQLKPKALTRILNKIESYDKIQILYFDKCMINDRGSVCIGSYLIMNTCLKELTIANDSIGTIGLEAIGRGLQDNSTLEYLNLKNSTLNDIDPIITSLRINYTLSTLNISSNYIYNQTYILLNDLLLTNSSIKILDISDTAYCEFSFYGCKFFIQNALKTNIHLEELNMSSNYIDDDTAVLIAETLIVNKTLLKINLCNNIITKIGYDYIMNNLKYNKNIIKIELQSNPIETNLSELHILLRNNYNRNKFWKYPSNLAKFDKQFYQNLIHLMLYVRQYTFIIPNEIWIYICEFHYK